MSDMSSSLLATTGDRTIDKLQRLPFLDVSRRDQSRRKPKSKKRRRHRSSSTSSSSRLSSSDSWKRKSKRSKHLHKKRKRRSISSDSSPSFSPSDNQFHDYGRCKRSRHSLQAVETPIMLQPAEIANISTIPQPEHVIQSSAKDSSSESEM